MTSLVSPRLLSEPQVDGPGEALSRQIGQSGPDVGDQDASDSPSPPGFPAALGPFGVTRTLVLPTANPRSGTYEVPLVGALEDLVLSMRRNLPSGCISPLHPVTLSDAERDLASIPQDATHFCWAYPLSGFDLSDQRKASIGANAIQTFGALATAAATVFTSNTVVEDDSIAADAAAVLLISFGGYLYFDSVGACVQANAIGMGTDLVFCAPELWRADFTHALHATGRIQRITIVDLFDKGAR